MFEKLKELLQYSKSISIESTILFHLICLSHVSVSRRFFAARKELINKYIFFNAF